MTTSGFDTLMRLLAKIHDERLIICWAMNTSRRKVREAVAALQRYSNWRKTRGRLPTAGQSWASRKDRRDHQAYRDGLAAATRHGHQPLIDEYTEALQELE